VVQPNSEELEEKAWFYRNVDTLDITLEKFSTALDDQISHAPTDGSANGQLAAS
jgi:hypothetical protein